MELNDLFNSIIKYNLEEETPEIVFKNIYRFLNKTTNKKMQAYNNFSDMITLSQIWTIIRKKQCGDLGVKFIKKIMTIEKGDPYKNKFMMGFANNISRTLGNLSFLRESGGASIANKILNTYTNPDKRPLFPDYM